MKDCDGGAGVGVGVISIGTVVGAVLKEKKRRNKEKDKQGRANRAKDERGRRRDEHRLIQLLLHDVVDDRVRKKVSERERERKIEVSESSWWSTEGRKERGATHLMLIPRRTNSRTFVDEMSL